MKEIDGAKERFLKIVSSMDKALTLVPNDELAASIGVTSPFSLNHDAPGIVEFVSKELSEKPAPSEAAVVKPKVASTAEGSKDSFEETMEEFLDSAVKENIGGIMVKEDGEVVYGDEVKEAEKVVVTEGGEAEKINIAKGVEAKENVP